MRNMTLPIKARLRYRGGTARLIGPLAFAATLLARSGKAMQERIERSLSDPPSLAQTA